MGGPIGAHNQRGPLKEVVFENGVKAVLREDRLGRNLSTRLNEGRLGIEKIALRGQL